MKKKFRHTNNQEREKEWLKEEDYIGKLEAKHKKELEELTRKYEKKIAYLKLTKSPQYRCSRCLHSGHNKNNCKREKATEKEHQLYKDFSKKIYRSNPLFKDKLKLS